MKFIDDWNVFIKFIDHLEAAAAVDLRTQLKREAMNGLDRPGHCFYGDKVLLQMAMKYTLPAKFPNILREGGNGTVYEVHVNWVYWMVNWNKHNGIQRTICI